MKREWTDEERVSVFPRLGIAASSFADPMDWRRAVADRLLTLEAELAAARAEIERRARLLVAEGVIISRSEFRGAPDSSIGAPIPVLDQHPDPQGGQW